MAKLQAKKTMECSENEGHPIIPLSREKQKYCNISKLYFWSHLRAEVSSELYHIWWHVFSLKKCQEDSPKEKPDNDLETIFER